MLRSSMLYASTSVFFVSLTVLSLFAEQLLQLHKDLIALPFFAGGFDVLLHPRHHGVAGGTEPGGERTTARRSSPADGGRWHVCRFYSVCVIGCSRGCGEGASVYFRILGGLALDVGNLALRHQIDVPEGSARIMA